MRDQISSFDNRLPAQAHREPANPLAPDSSTDVALRITDRQLVRLLLVATETSSRFQREGVGHDALAWMYSPRRLFEGRSAIEAAIHCLPCRRAILLHGLSLGLDADPVRVDRLIYRPKNSSCSALIAAVLDSATNELSAVHLNRRWNLKGMS